MRGTKINCEEVKKKVNQLAACRQRAVFLADLLKNDTIPMTAELASLVLKLFEIEGDCDCMGVR